MKRFTVWNDLSKEEEELLLEVMKVNKSILSFYSYSLPESIGLNISYYNDNILSLINSSEDVKYNLGCNYVLRRLRYLPLSEIEKDEEKKPKIPSDIKKEIIGWIISGKRLTLMKDIIYYILKVLVEMSKKK